MDTSQSGNQPIIPDQSSSHQGNQKLRRIEKVFLWIGTFLFIGMTALGIYAIISHSDILAAVILFMIAALAIPLGVIQIWPEIKIHIRQSLLVGISIFICLLLVLSSLIGTSFLFPSPPVRVFPPLRVLFPTSQKIRIAVDMPLSGRSKSDGKSIADGAHFAIDQANK